MTVRHDSVTTTAGGPERDAPSTAGRRGAIAGAALLLACAAACALPWLLAAGAAVTAGAFAAGTGSIALGVLLTALLGGGLWLRRRRTRAVGAGCGSGDDCRC